MHRFYAPDIAASLELPEQEAQHALRVLRLTTGDTIEVVDGKGGLHTCRIAATHPKHCTVEIVESVTVAAHWGHSITLAIAPTKNPDRMEWMAEKATEMGVDRIIPLRCRYSERKELKTDRLRRVLAAAMKQSLKATLPQLDQMTPISSLLEQQLPGQKFIAYCGTGVERADFSHLYVPRRDVTVLIGPEGDFSPDEVASALKAGFTAVTFGQSRLRTETAALYAIAAIHALDAKT